MINASKIVTGSVTTAQVGLRGLISAAKRKHDMWFLCWHDPQLKHNSQ